MTSLLPFQSQRKAPFNGIIRLPKNLRSRLIRTRHGQEAIVLEASYKLTDPLLNPIRRVMPNIGGLDFSPVILFLLLGFLRNLLREYGLGLL